MSNDSLVVKSAAAAASVSAVRKAEERASAQRESVTREAPAEATRSDVATVELAARRIENYLKTVNRALEFRVDEPSGRTVVSVRDSATGELIRQIPSEEVLRLAEMAEDQTIVLVSEKV